MADKEVRKIVRRDLAKAIDKAVQLATSRHKIELAANVFDRDEFRLPPWINGRMVRGQIDLDQAYKSAETIISDMGFAPGDMQAVAIKIDKDILVGFIDRFRDQIDIQDMFGGVGTY